MRNKAKKKFSSKIQQSLRLEGKYKQKKKENVPKIEIQRHCRRHTHTHSSTMMTDLTRYTRQTHTLNNICYEYA